MEVQKIIQNFIVDAKIVECEPYGNGRIHNTFRVRLENGQTYILQEINHKVFENVPKMMQNIHTVTEHFRKRGKQTLEFVPTQKGQFFYQEKNGSFWRMMPFQSNTQTYETLTSCILAEQVGGLLANFHKDLLDLEVANLHTTTTVFFDLPKSLRELDKTILQMTENLAIEVEELLALVNAKREEMLGFYKENLPLRLTHNDAKLNNMLFSAENQPLYLIDLDTVATGFVHYDFGDMARTSCTTAKDDETNLDKVQFSLALYKLCKKGYLAVAEEFLTEKEIAYLDFSVKLMTYLMAVRFLTDYLNGNVFYKITYTKQNLHRACCQFRLFREIEKVLV